MCLGQPSWSTSCGGVGIHRNPIPGNPEETSTTSCLLNGATIAGNVARHTSHPQHLTHNTRFSAPSGFQTPLLAVGDSGDAAEYNAACSLLEMGIQNATPWSLCAGEQLSEIEKAAVEKEADVSRRICVVSPKLYNTSRTYEFGNFKTAVFPKYASATQKEIREDLSALSSVSTVRTAMSLRQRTADAVSANLPLHNSTSDALCLECGLPGDVLQVVTREHCIAQEVETFLSERSCFYARVAGLLDRRLRCAHAPAVLRCKPQPCVAVSPMRHTKTNSTIGSALHRLHCEGLRGRHRHVWNMVGVSALVRVDCGVVNDNVYSIAQFILNRLTIRP